MHGDSVPCERRFLPHAGTILRESLPRTARSYAEIGVEIGAELAVQLAPRAREARLDSAGGHAERIADVLDPDALDVMHDDDYAIVGGQAVDRPMPDRPLLLAGGESVGLARPGGRVP